MNRISKLYDTYGSIKCRLMHCIGALYSIYFISQLLYCLYANKIFFIAYFCTITTICIEYAVILDYLYTETVGTQSNMINMLVSAIISIVWYVIIIMKYKLTLGMVILWVFHQIVVFLSSQLNTRCQIQIPAYKVRFSFVFSFVNKLLFVGCCVHC